LQKPVLLAALRLLEREDGPALDPRAQPDSTWHPLFAPEAAGKGSAAALAARLEALLLTFASVRRNQSRLVQLLKTILETAVGPVQPIEPHNSGARMAAEGDHFSQWRSAATSNAPLR
jgi:hypothetical protein